MKSRKESSITKSSCFLSGNRKFNKSSLWLHHEINGNFIQHCSPHPSSKHSVLSTYGLHTVGIAPPLLFLNPLNGLLLAQFLKTSHS